MSTYKRKPRTVYLDQAATSFPKPPEVLEAMTRCMVEAGGNPGRSSHRLALAAAEEVFACREEAAQMFDASPDRVCFTSGATHAINAAIKGLLPLCKHPKPHVLCSDMEHNAVYRPLWKLQSEGRITLDTLTILPFWILNTLPPAM